MPGRGRRIVVWYASKTSSCYDKHWRSVVPIMMFAGSNLASDTMKIKIHIIATILYIAAYLYVTDGVRLTMKGRFANVIFYMTVQWLVYMIYDFKYPYGKYK